jgi:hypothetical protein
MLAQPSGQLSFPILPDRVVPVNFSFKLCEKCHTPWRFWDKPGESTVLPEGLTLTIGKMFRIATILPLK